MFEKLRAFVPHTYEEYGEYVVEFYGEANKIIIQNPQKGGDKYTILRKSENEFEIIAVEGQAGLTNFSKLPEGMKKATLSAFERIDKYLGSLVHDSLQHSKSAPTDR